MQNKLELSLLIDYYGEFLTDNQCEMLKLNCEEDFSLAEIAEQKGISRQGVRDALHGVQRWHLKDFLQNFRTYSENWAERAS